MRGVLRAISGNARHLECPGRTGTYLPPLDDAEPRHAQRRHDTHTNDLRRRFKRDLATLSPLALAMNRNAIMAAKRANACLGPAIPAPRRLAGPIEPSCHLLVGHLARQLSDQGQRVLGNCPAMLTSSIHLELQRCVIAALPMQHHFDAGVLDPGDDLTQCRAEYPLACRRTGGRMRPGPFQVCTEPHQVLALLLAYWQRPFRIQPCDLTLD